MSAQRVRWGNLTVPYTAMWTGEVEQREPAIARVSIDGRTLRMLSEGVNAPGTGKPLFKVTHNDRVREVILKRVCQMCMEPLPHRVVTFNQAQVDQRRPLISDGLPMCPHCALEAFEACPGMQAQKERGQLRCWISPVGAWLHAPVVLGPRDPRDGGDERVNALIMKDRALLYSGPKLVLTAWEGLTLDRLRETAAAAAPAVS